MRHMLWLVSLWVLAGGAIANGQNATIPLSQASAFLGTWTFAMTNPPDSEQTVKIWDQQGVVAASLQVGRFPPTAVTGMVKDGGMLILTTTVRENGAPIWAVIALTLDGDVMNLAQMMEKSQTIKRGTARRRVGP